MPETQELVTDLQIRDNLTAGLAKAKAEVAGFGDAAAVHGSKAAGALDRVGISAKNLIGAFVGFQVIQGTVDFLGDAVQAAKDDEASVAHLTAALKANVGAFSGQAEAIDQAIASGARLGFTDDEVRESIARLSAATHDLNSALAIQNAAEDLARFKQISLGEATAALVKIEAGRFKGLADLGIVLEKGATQVEAIAAVEKVAAGQAEAFGETTAGAAKRAEIAFDELKEKIGKELLPVLTDVANIFSGATQEGIDKQAAQIVANTKNFVKTATTAQIQAAREGIAAQLKANDSAFGPGNLFGSHDKIVQILGLLDEALGPVRQGLDESTLSANLNAIAIAKAAVAADQLKASQSVAGDIKETDIVLGESKRAADLAAQGYAAMDLAARNLAYRVSVVLNPALKGTADSMGQFSVPFGSNDIGEGNLREHNAALQFTADANARAQADRDAAAAKRLAQAKADAEAYAATIRDKVAGAFDKAKERDESLFASLHAHHLQAINDAETLAEKRHEGSVQAISDALKLRLQQDAAPVTAAEKAQSDIEISRQNRDLHASLSAAQAGGDPEAIRQALESLQSFQAAQTIAHLRQDQAEHDLAAQAKAAADQKSADDALAAAKLAQAAAIKAVTARDKKRQDDYDAAFAALKEKDKNASPARANADIVALDKRFGISTDAAGVRHLADVLDIAIKKIQIPPPVFKPTINVYVAAPTLNGRLVGAAIASSQSPSATPGVRSGALRPARG